MMATDLPMTPLTREEWQIKEAEENAADGVFEGTPEKSISSISRSEEDRRQQKSPVRGGGGNDRGGRDDEEGVPSSASSPWLLVFVVFVILLLISLDLVAASLDGKEPSNDKKGPKPKWIVIVITILVVGAIFMAGLGYLVYRCLVPRARTLDPSIVESFPKLMYPTPNDVGFGVTECSICLQDFTDGARVSVHWATTSITLSLHPEMDDYKTGIVP
ncbi:hypothetical protein RHGRI_011886 [Rhododendron griersonianum]|uniref:Uncharacterized protein n=1 Tax=Rhododendron griersonianum TaxID=479676 RepID=A0AAV6KPS7_9ERIC|nr:hypothetical protein RHGRI_011886 [Rhododendron griersonianum]